MRFQSFEFTNFRGVSKTTLDLARNPKSRINVLVGLNESGKTTILEALNHFRSNPDLSAMDPSQTDRTPEAYQAMLPIAQRALFNGSIAVHAKIRLEPGDWGAIHRFACETFGFAEINYFDEFSINHQVDFKDSQYAKTWNYWHIGLEARKKGRGTKLKRLSGDPWLKVVDFIGETMLPNIVYFPAAVLQFPDRIVLEDSEQEGAESKNEFYCGVLEDVLRAIDARLDLQTHLIARAKSDKASDRDNLDALLLRIGTHLEPRSSASGKRSSISRCVICDSACCATCNADNVLWK